MFKYSAVAFDVGHTLVDYPFPLNWQAMYAPALKKVMEACGLEHTDLLEERGKEVLLAYNTRVHPRDHEVSADIIFTELLSTWHADMERLPDAKQAFFTYFQGNSVCYADAEPVLNTLKQRGLKTAVLTDVAYGMDNAYSLRDIAALQPYLDVCLTSVDVGYRKPHPAGYERLLHFFNMPPEKVVFVGDEEKDIVGANRVGMVSVLISRSGTPPDYGQTHTIRALSDILTMIKGDS